MQTLLFFDDEPLTYHDNVVRKLGQPSLIPESVYHEAAGNCAWGYPGVFRDLESGVWRMLFQADPAHVNRGGDYMLVVESDDGLHWQPCDTRALLPDLPNRLAPHQVLPGGVVGELSSVYVDHRADPEARIKILTSMPHGGGARLWESPDGLRWTEAPGARWQAASPDPPTFACWNDVRQRYLLYSRPTFCDRRICWFETADWRSFSPATLALHADALDAPLAQLYGMCVVPYAGVYLGLLWVYGCPKNERSSYPHLYWGGKMHCQLAYSLNSTNWTRGLRDPFIPNGEPGSPTAGIVQPSRMVTLDDGSLRFYADASTREHGHCDPADGYLVAYALRRDGFVFLESAGGPARVDTRTLLWYGGETELNVAATGGEIRMQITEPSGQPINGYTFADAVPFSGDDTAWTPQWKNGRCLAALAGRPVRLEIELTNARLYAVRGDFLLIRAGDVWAMPERMPQFRPGFDPAPELPEAL